MKKEKKMHISAIWTMVAIGCIFIFSAIAINIHSSWISSFDNIVISKIQGMESPPLTQVMLFFTWLGSTPQVLVISVITMLFLFFGLKHRKELWLFLISGSGSVLLNVLLKLKFSRQRPTLHRLIEETGYSFPSGHSMAAFTLYFTIAFLIWKHMPNTFSRVLTILVSAFLIVIIGVSRIYLGVHFPSDVVGGYFISGCWSAVCIMTYQYLLEYKWNPKPQNAM
ncbi:undecaprenyl-diphosphatase [Paenibacillus turicensis]|uniref:Undecaprenyl-diphosphatase n=1 Tax=Paenibacillus turicensis TaxID=160487 RepID=A0ABS4FNS8_9BACL|nr:phosphatase PAP2 family protein [Paenibacillus turicensis]MBP1904034.1 undecaprenyl-diphosphatase [Paenibacillus turicensis]